MSLTRRRKWARRAAQFLWFLSQDPPRREEAAKLWQNLKDKGQFAKWIKMVKEAI